MNLGLAKATQGLLQFLPKMPAARLFVDIVFGWPHSHRSKAGLVKDQALAERLGNMHVELFTDLAPPTRGKFAALIRRSSLSAADRERAPVVGVQTTYV